MNTYTAERLLAVARARGFNPGPGAPPVGRWQPSGPLPGHTLLEVMFRVDNWQDMQLSTEEGHGTSWVTFYYYGEPAMGVVHETEHGPYPTPEAALAFAAWYLAAEAHRELMYEQVMCPDICGRSISVGPAHDPYGTTCDLPPGHAGKHEGPNPFDQQIGLHGRVEWRGGGYCAGDPLPVRDLRWLHDQGGQQ